MQLVCGSDIILQPPEAVFGLSLVIKYYKKSKKKEKKEKVIILWNFEPAKKSINFYAQVHLSI